MFIITQGVPPLRHVFHYTGRVPVTACYHYTGRAPRYSMFIIT